VTACRYLADGTVARLSRWLRLAGVDVAQGSGTDSEILRLARETGRRVLTRCRRLARRDPERVTLIASERPREQLGEVLPGAGVCRPLTRCSICNALLVRIEREEARPLVPPYVFGHRAFFAHCPSCGRVYWEGTHVERIRETLGRQDSRGSRDAGPARPSEGQGGTT
jgi:uncharacterized protein with PIN domain